MAVLDADALIPILSCDVLLTMFEVDLYLPVVTDVILDEVERNLITIHPHIDPAALRRRVAQMRTALDSHVQGVGDANAIDIMDVNAKDRHVMAAAMTNRATLVVSNDRRLRGEINARA